MFDFAIKKLLAMKKTVLTFVMAGLFLSASEAEAKGRFSVIPRVGFNLSSIDGEGSLDAYSTRLGFTGGVDAEYRFIPQLGVSLGVAYSQQGCNTNEVWNYKDFDKDISWRIKSHQLHYLKVPLMLNFHVGKGFTLKTGAEVGYLLAARDKGPEYGYWGIWRGVTTVPPGDYGTMYYPDGSKAPEPSPNGLDGDVQEFNEKGSKDMIDAYHRFYCAIPIGLSYEYRHFMVDARFHFNLVKIVRAQPDNLMDNRCFSITVGYRFNL